MSSDSTSSPLYGIRHEHVRIAMSDGVALAADLFMPEGVAPDEKIPAVLEYLPYRKDDLTVDQTRQLACYIVPRGYVAARVDIRGTGGSEGQLLEGEYTEQEQLDALEVIDWLSRQPWSNGRVGMWGISWGGFNSIQLAMRRPPALKAIVALMASDDVFHDDKYVDGILQIDDYKLFIDHINAISSAPDFPLDEEHLSARFDQPPWLLSWMREQRDGPYWRRQSLSPGYEAIEIPTLLIGGWLDGYRDSIPRMLERMTAPLKAIVGPWNHAMPHDAVPGPTIEWRYEAVRWWDQWLKERETGILNEPRLSVYVRHWHPPDLSLREIPGEWRTEEGWPIRRSSETTLYLRADHLLGQTSSSPETHHLLYIPSVGPSAGIWWAEVTPDQRPDDALSLAYDSAPLDNDLEILGIPRVRLWASADAPLAHWFVRLSDVAPDGTVTLVTGAALNGAHRESRVNPQPLDPGEVYPLQFELHFTSWVFPRGHRIRIAVSNALWPMAWPTPFQMTTSLYLEGDRPSHVVLPVIPHEDRPAPLFLQVETCAPPSVQLAGDSISGRWTWHRRDLDGRTTVRWDSSSSREFTWGREKGRTHMTHMVSDERSDVASTHGEAESTVDLPNHRLTWRSVLDVASDATHFLCQFRRELFRDGLLIRERAWEERIPRDHQ